MMATILKFLHLQRDDQPSNEPLDKVQMDAAKDRLSQRAEQLTQSFDELSRMIKRMKRVRGRNGS